LRSSLYSVLFVLLCHVAIAQEQVFQALERYDTSFIKKYVSEEGDVDIVKEKKIKQSSFKLKKKKYSVNLFEFAIESISIASSESNPFNKVKAYRNLYLLLENIQRSKNKVQLLDRVFTLSISLGDVDLVRKIYLLGANINYQCQLCYGRTPLLIALGYNQNLEIMKFLLSLKPDLTITDFDGKNALHYSAQLGNFEMLKYFLRNELIDINARDKHQRTAAMYAALNGDYEIFNYLVEKGADLNLVANKGITVLHAAAQSGDVDFFRHVHYVSKLSLWNNKLTKRDVLQYTSRKEMLDEPIRLYIVRYTIKQNGMKYYKRKKRKMRFKNLLFPGRIFL
jgi:hypothetical protein